MRPDLWISLHIVRSDMWISRTCYDVVLVFPNVHVVINKKSLIRVPECKIRGAGVESEGAKAVRPPSNPPLVKRVAEDRRWHIPCDGKSYIQDELVPRLLKRI